MAREIDGLSLPDGRGEVVTDDRRCKVQGVNGPTDRGVEGRPDDSACRSP
jgi:hypothetical protein